MPDSRESLKVPEGIALSRKASRIIERAVGVGVPPFVIESFLEDAATTARETGRTKIGPFGPCKEAFGRLRERTEASLASFNRMGYSRGPERSY